MRISYGPGYSVGPQTTVGTAVAPLVELQRWVLAQSVPIQVRTPPPAEPQITPEELAAIAHRLATIPDAQVTQTPTGWVFTMTPPPPLAYYRISPADTARITRRRSLPEAAIHTTARHQARNKRWRHR